MGCLDSIIRLCSARTQLWRHGEIPEQLRELWAEARRLLPDWPGFQGLALDSKQLESLDACRGELNDFLDCIGKRFETITITEDAGIAKLVATKRQ